MPYQLDDNEIKLLLPLFGSQAATLPQEMLNLRQRLSDCLTTFDVLNHQTTIDDNTVSYEYHILHSKINSNFL
jgi:hypothetical protein